MRLFDSSLLRRRVNHRLFISIATAGALLTSPALAISGQANVAHAESPTAVYNTPDCRAHTLAVNDDDSTQAVALPFTLNYFGRNYRQLWVNNNGNVTFGGPQSHFTPYTIQADTPPIIAPFFADVDTRGTGTVTYGTTTFQGFPTFCVNWTGVGYYDTQTDLKNTFQLLLVSRPDVGNNAFDVVFNYNQIQWETGDASGGSGGTGGTSAGAGFSNGDGNPNHFYQLPGSLQPGAFLDANPSGLAHRSVGATVPGRYAFHVRSTTDPGLDVTGLARSFPYRHIGYNFGNPGLRTWRNAARLDVGDVLTHDDMTRTFSDWDSVSEGHFLWWTYSRDSHFFDALADTMNKGMCFGLALTGGRFDASLEQLRNASARRSDNLWNRGDAFQLPEPGGAGSGDTYNVEFLRMVADSHVTQFSSQIQTTLQRQHDAYQDPTSGFTAFKKQLISVLRNGKNLYDHTHKTDTATGNRYAGITLQVDGWGGHEVLAYSLQVADNGALKIGVWDNNFPNTPYTITVNTDGSWTYNAPYGSPFPNTTLSMRGGTGHRLGLLAALPLYSPTGFNYYPQGPGTQATLGSGALVDIPAGVNASATDHSGRPVGRELVMSNGGVDAGSILNLTSGTGAITVAGGSSPSLAIRSNGAFLAADSTSSQALTVRTAQDTGSIHVTGGAADLVAARGPVLAATEGTSMLKVATGGAVTVSGTGSRTLLKVITDVRGEQVTATLHNGRLGVGHTVTYSRAKVRKAIKTASRKKQRVTLAAPHKVKAGKRFSVHGTVTTTGGKVRLYERVTKHGHKRWTKLRSTRVKDKKYRFLMKVGRVGKHVYQVRRAAATGYQPGMSQRVTIKVTPRRS